MTKILDIAGERFGRLIAVSRTAVPRGRAPGTISKWLCTCDCGGSVTTTLSSLRQGKTRSCGCLQPDVTRKRSTKHGHSPGGKTSATYNSWRAMIERCTNPKNKKFSYYGERGIRVCDRWRSFENFLADMGERPKGMTLDREDNDGDYRPGNCKWSTYREQANNRRQRKAAELGIYIPDANEGQL